MNGWLDNYGKKFAALTLRGQLIVLVATMLIIYFIWHTLLFAPAQQKKVELQAQIEQVKSKLAEVKTELQQKKQEIAAMRPGEQLARNKKTILHTNRVIPMLQELMNKQPGLELVSISTRPPEPVNLDQALPSRINPNQVEAAKMVADKSLQPSADSADSNLFKHAVTIRFHGDYFNTLRFLEKIESLPWVVLPDDILYSVTTYPQAEVTLRINLLSFSGGII
jgi:MSHA biogenesis protein MshJ